MKSLNFENWCQKVQKFDIQSQFSKSKVIQIFLCFGWRTLCFKEHFTQKEHFALLHLAQKNSLPKIGLLQFAL